MQYATHYVITYSVGTSIHDERRYQIRGVTAADLARRIASIQGKGKSIRSVEIDHSVIPAK